MSENRDQSLQANQRNDNRRILKIAAGVAAATFFFGFAMVPLYRIACEKVFGIKLDDAAVSVGDVEQMQVDTSRWVTVEFDATTHSGLAWNFSAQKQSVKVHPGVVTEAMFYASNNSTHPIVGQAVPSVAPSTASIYFNKTECFCFTEQLLNAGESREMPVRFVVDPDLPKGISTLTLSYTFYNNEIATRRVQNASAASD